MDSTDAVEMSHAVSLGREGAVPREIRFVNGWRDLTITPLVQFATFAIAASLTWETSKHISLSTIGALGVGYIWLVAATMVLLAFLRQVFPVPPGTYTYANDAKLLYRFNLYSYLCITNLYFLYTLPLIWQPYRKYYYALMGTKFGSGLISVGGRIAEPHLVEVEEGAILGDDTLLLPHATSAQPELTVRLAPIHIGRNAVIGARAIIFPGVSIGARATVAANSVVTADTQIPPGEIWGGIPARRIRGSGAVR